MKIPIPLRRQALAGALVLALIAACQPPQSTQTPWVKLVTAEPAAAPTANAVMAPSPAVATPAGGANAAASDLSQLPSPLEGWQMGDRSVPISVVEYGDFQ